LKIKDKSGNHFSPEHNKIDCILNNLTNVGCIECKEKSISKCIFDLLLGSGNLAHFKWENNEIAAK